MNSSEKRRQLDQCVERMKYLKNSLEGLTGKAERMDILREMKDTRNKRQRLHRRFKCNTK